MKVFISMVMMWAVAPAMAGDASPRDYETDRFSPAPLAWKAANLIRHEVPDDILARLPRADMLRIIDKLTQDVPVEIVLGQNLW